ncbi:SIMPL domain-containing protein [Roseateles violae]|uniref:SIMPL domain-containing protein n=1 Tax=Roseateles violae TaxID=3058042 RepID=A0ABT8DPU3_9BURK|nr:SIMPL domain-containing protein [Pelomonas sp. PFR6]MDN3919998.1 SIMPL domain-containing protein [Pelomonas sp. PFR6]
MKNKTLSTLASLALLLPALGAQAQSAEAPRDRLNLSASASAEVTRDLLGITFSTTKEGGDAAAVQTALKQALDAALAEARKIAKPGAVELQAGNFSLQPRYTAPRSGAAPTISGWQGTAELLVEGKDAAAIAQLSGRIASMSIARVGYGLSKEQREKAEAELTAQAIARFRARAADYAGQFGYGGYQIGEVSINAADSGPVRPMPMLRAKAMSADAGEALPVEAGKATVSVTVAGSVQLLKK